MAETSIHRYPPQRTVRPRPPARGVNDSPLPLPDMSVEVKNFGPIAKGKVDIRPLTVFAGPSNAGKSWLATLIYALGLLTDVRSRGHLDSTRFDQARIPPSKLPGRRKFSFPDSPEQWLQAIEDNVDICLAENDLSSLKSVASFSKNDTESELCRCYGIPSLGSLIRKGGKTRRTAKVSARAGAIVHSMTIGAKGDSFSSHVDFSRQPVVFPTSRIRRSNFSNFPSKIASLLLDTVIDRKENTLAEGNYRARRLAIECLKVLYSEREINEMHFLPADRGGIMHAHAAVVNALIGGAARVGIGQAQLLPVLTGVLSDFMEKLVVMANMKGLRSHVSKEIEKGLNDNILCGTVDVESSEIGYPRFVYNPNGWNEGLHLTSASSMVSEVGPVALFLRYFVNPGDLLILEEPEAHLHPALQRLFTQEVVKWVQQGIRVVLTTHSEWVLEELSNIVARSKNKTTSRWRSGQQILASNNVGVWEFNFIKADCPEKGTQISEIKWSEDEGGYEAGFYNVMAEQLNEWGEATGEI